MFVPAVSRGRQASSTGHGAGRMLQTETRGRHRGGPGCWKGEHRRWPTWPTPWCLSPASWCFCLRCADWSGYERACERIIGHCRAAELARWRGSAAPSLRGAGMSGTGVLANVIAAVLALALIVYLFVALVKPEKF